jgi:hypothetical protein
VISAISGLQGEVNCIDQGEYTFLFIFSRILLAFIFLVKTMEMNKFKFCITEFNLWLLADTVVTVSIIVLVALFSIQKFGTSKMGSMFSPILALWFIALGTIGIYDIAMHDISVLRAINPAYIYYFFKKNGKKAWSALGGCVLCVTGKSFLSLSS